MEKDDKKGGPPWPKSLELKPQELAKVLEVACVKRGAEYAVVIRSEVSGKVAESVYALKTDKRIAAAKLQEALFGSAL